MPGAGRDEERGGDPALADPPPEPHAFPAELRDDDEDSDDAPLESLVTVTAAQ